MTSYSARKYEFPNISVNSRIQGPQQFTATWNNTVGVAGPATKGALVGRINSRQDLVTQIGEDDSLMSKAIRAAMLQGATNFVYSRALPRAKGGSGSISFSNPNGSIYTEPLIGATVNRTVGLQADFSYISPPIYEDSNIVAYSTNALNETTYIKPETNIDDELSLEFEGIGSFVLVKQASLDENNYDFFLRTTEDPDLVTTTDLVATGFDAIAGSDIEATTGVEVLKVSFPKSSITKDNYVQAFVPGMRVDSNAGGATLAAPGEIVSELIDEGLNYAFFLKAEVTSAGNGSFKLLLPDGTNEFPILDVFKVLYRTSQGSYLPGEVVYVGKTNTISSPISYLVLNREDDAGVAKPIEFYSVDTIEIPGALPTDPVTYEYNITPKATGVTYKVGEVGDTYVKVVASVQTITIAKTTVGVGETDVNATGFPETALAFVPNKPVSDVLSELKVALNDNAVLTTLALDVAVNLSELPYSLNFTLGVEGSVTNNLKYKITRISNGLGTADIEFSSNGSDLFNTPINFVGGVDRVVPASRFFYDRLGNKVLYLEAISPGNYGNNIKVTIQPIDQSNFRLEVREDGLSNYLKPPDESFYLSNTTIDTATGIYPETLSSNLIRAYYVPAREASGQGLGTIDFNKIPLRVAPPDSDGVLPDLTFETHPSYVGAQYLVNVPLIGGAEPNEQDAYISEESYIDAIDRLEDENVFMIIAPGLIAGDVKYTKAINALIQQADQSTPYNGLRIAALAVPPKLTTSRAEILNAQYSSPNLVLLGGWSTLITSKGIGYDITSPEGFYAGLLATTDTHVSPASSYANKYVNGALNIDTDGRLNSLDTFTKNNIEMLFNDKVSRKVKFLNGRTTAGDLNNRWVAVKRQENHMTMNLVANLAWARSAPNTSETRQQVASAIDAYLTTEVNRGAIAGFKPTVVNNSDSSRFSQGYLDMVVVWTPIYPADYVTIDFIRSITTNFTLQIS